MHKRLRKINDNGFTLIELMIVIAIIGILAVIAIPNFLVYRNRSFCSMAESDAHAIAAALHDYYTPSGRLNFPPDVIDDLGITLSINNTGKVEGTMDNIVVSVTDGSKRCPSNYQSDNSGWEDGVFSVTM